MYSYGAQKTNGQRPKIGLALSGGSLRGLAHIGVLKALHEYEIPIDYIAGTSAGAIVASLYACGYKPDEICSLAHSISISDLFTPKLPFVNVLKKGKQWFSKRRKRLPSGIISGDKFEQLFNNIYQNTAVNTTKIPLAITAVDLYSADTVFFISPQRKNKEIINARYCYDTELSKAVRASISIPGIFRPLRYQGMLLVDGAIKNNLPTDILHYMGADYIIAVDLGFSGEANYEIKNVTDILWRCVDIMNWEVTLLKSENYADLIIRPQSNIVFPPKSKQIDQCIADGEAAVKSHLKTIRQVLKTKI